MERSAERGIDVDPTVQAVLAAESQLAATWQRLNALRQAAFYGGRYNSAEYDGAVLAYRNAERALRAARSAWLQGRITTPAAPIAPAASAVMAVETVTTITEISAQRAAAIPAAPSAGCLRAA